LEQHFERHEMHDDFASPKEIRAKAQRPASPEKLKSKSPNVVECSPNVIQHSPSRETFRPLETSGQDTVREIRDREFQRLFQTAQALRGRESPEMRLPKNMEAAWQRFLEQRRSLELNRDRTRSMDSSKNTAKDFSTNHNSSVGSGTASVNSLSQSKDLSKDHEETSKEPEQVEQQHRKQAWVVKDETLASVPEDSTLDSVTSDLATSSEVDSDGKVITHTSRKHLPNDPKLLKLHRKIAQQREKHRVDHHRELRRQEKILKMERLLRAQEKALRELQQQSDVSSSTFTASEITDASTINEDSSTPYIDDEPMKDATQKPHFLQLQEVDYKSPQRAPRRHSSQAKKSSKQNHENEVLKASKAAKNQKTSGELKLLRDKANVDVYIRKENTKDFGATCPTPLMQSPKASKRRYHAVNMVSEGVQTTPSVQKHQSKSTSMRSENTRTPIPEVALQKRQKSPTRRPKPKRKPLLLLVLILVICMVF
jgi:hypothetical protein